MGDSFWGRLDGRETMGKNTVIMTFSFSRWWKVVMAEVPNTNGFNRLGHDAGSRCTDFRIVTSLFIRC